MSLNKMLEYFAVAASGVDDEGSGTCVRLLLVSPDEFHRPRDMLVSKPFTVHGAMGCRINPSWQTPLPAGE